MEDDFTVYQFMQNSVIWRFYEETTKFNSRLAIANGLLIYGF